MIAPAIFTILAIAGFILWFGCVLWFCLTEVPAVARHREVGEDEDMTGRWDR